MNLRDKDTIVFAGDSVTDAEKLTTEDGLGRGYVKLMRDALIAFRPAEEYRVINAGVNGNTSRELLARWEKDVSEKKPDILFCMIGINDVWRHFDYLHPSARFVSEEEFGQNLQAICEKSKQVRDFCLIPPYFMERNRSDEMRCMTERYADIVRKVAAQRGVRTLELQPSFDAYMLHRSGLSISWDRVHPGTIGALIIARSILSELGLFR